MNKFLSYLFYFMVVLFPVAVLFFKLVSPVLYVRMSGVLLLLTSILYMIIYKKNVIKKNTSLYSMGEKVNIFARQLFRLIIYILCWGFAFAFLVTASNKGSLSNFEYMILMLIVGVSIVTMCGLAICSRSNERWFYIFSFMLGLGILATQYAGYIFLVMIAWRVFRMYINLLNITIYIKTKSGRLDVTHSIKRLKRTYKKNTNGDDR